MLLGIDLGTTGVKLLVLSKEGRVLFRHFEGYKLYTPKPGWSEEKPSEWWNAVLKSIRSAINFLGGAHGVTALALSGQMHGSVFLDRKGKVIRPAILWNDTRTFNQRREIEEKIGKELLLEEVQNLPLEGFTAPKILWLKENEPGNYDKLWKVLLPKDYINYRLIGRVCTEATDASGTGLFDVVNREWAEDIIEAIGLRMDIFPEVIASVDVVGKVSRRVSELTGINEDCLVIAGGADNACGALGAGVIAEGQMLISIGSSGVIFLPTSNPQKRDPLGRLHFFSHAGNLWCNMGVTLSAGLSLKWFKEVFGESEVSMSKVTGRDAYDLLLDEAQSTPLGSEGVYYLPYLNGERTPHMDAKARGVFFGISLRHKKGHFVRSILEGVAYSMRDSIEIARTYGLKIVDARVVGGGTKSGFWVQIISDILNIRVSVLSTNEGPAFGAGILAAVGSKSYEDLEEAVKAVVKPLNSVDPISENVRKYEERYQLYKELYPVMSGTMSKSFDVEASS